MKWTPLTRLIVAAILFIAWLGYLTYLVATTAHPLVLSRPQFLVSDVDVIAKVSAQDDHPNSRVAIESVYWARAPQFKPENKEIDVVNLSRVTKENGWQGPGDYILALVKSGNEYKLASIPRSPGFEPEARDAGPRIYPVNSQTLSQLAAIRQAGTAKGP